MINGIDEWAITKMDVLDSFETIKICVAYECDGVRYDTVPARVKILERCVPVYEEIEGWQSSTCEASSWDELPPKAQAYVRRLVELTGTRAGIVSVGPRRASTIVLKQESLATS